VKKTTEFKIDEGTGTERRDTSVSISILDLAKFNQIKGHLSYYKKETVSSQEVMAELINTWIDSKRKIELGDSN